MIKLKQNILDHYGEVGKKWLNELGDMTKKVVDTWALTNLSPLPGLSFNYVFKAKCLSHHKNVVIKIGIDSSDMKREAAALSHFSGRSCVKCLAFDSDLCALMLEEISPGTTLADLYPKEDEKALSHFLSLLETLHACSTAPKPNIFPTMTDWLRELDIKNQDKTTHQLFEKARGLSRELIQESTKMFLLHGDLHHDNCLKNKDHSYLAIDPKGVIGDPLFELGAFLINPLDIKLLSESSLKSLTTKRLEQMHSTLATDLKKIKAWSFVRVMLAAAWSLSSKEKTNEHQALRVAQSIYLTT